MIGGCTRTIGSGFGSKSLGALINGTFPAHTPTTTINLGSSTFLDLARVVATNLVLIGHTRLIFLGPDVFSTGGLGVVIFFFLSGFLITLVALRRWRLPGGQMGGFLIDRVARIFTPFIPILAFVALVNILFDLSQHPILGTNSGPLAFVGNLLLLNDYPLFQFLSHFGPVAAFYPRSYNGSEPFWTIPIEFWTYVVFAAFAFVLVRGERPGFVQSALILVALPVFVWNGFAGGAGNLSLLWVMGAIAGFFWIHLDQDALRRTKLGVALMAFGLLCLAGRIADIGFKSYDMQENLLTGIAFFGALMVMSRFDRVPSWLARPIAFVAGYSYSLYLIHNIVVIIFHEKLDLFGTVPTMIAAMIAAHLSAIAAYYLFERHYHLVGRRLKEALAGRARTAAPPLAQG